MADQAFPIDPTIARYVLAIGTGAATSYAVHLGVEEAVQPKTKTSRRVGTGAALLVGSLVVYHLLGQESGWKLPF